MRSISEEGFGCPGHCFRGYGALGASPISKVVASIRTLAYGSSADLLDDYVRMGESTIMECLKHFVKAAAEVIGEEYRPPMPMTLHMLCSFHCRD